MDDLYSNISPAASLAPQVAEATADGAAVDLLGFMSATVLVHLGNFGGTTPTATVKIQSSPDSSDWTDVAAGDLIGGALPALTGANDTTIYRRGYRGTARYLRVIISAVAGTDPTLPISATVVRGLPRHAPIA